MCQYKLAARRRPDGVPVVPVASLPNRSLCEIFASFDVKTQRMLISSVCREWCEILRLCPAGALDLRHLGSATPGRIVELCERYKGARELKIGEFSTGRERHRAMKIQDVLDVVEESRMYRLRSIELQGAWSHKHGVIGIFSRAYVKLHRGGLSEPSEGLINGVGRCRSLTRLVLGHTECIDDTLLEALVDRLPHLAELYTRPTACCHVSDEGMRALARRKMRFLAIESDLITDQGVEACVACGTLEHLYLHGGGMTSATLRIIAQSCKRLKTLELPSSVLYPTDAVEAVLFLQSGGSDGDMVNESYQQLMEALPDLHIRFV